MTTTRDRWLPLRTVGPTFLANCLNQAAVVVSQLAVVPLLLAHWGVDGLGTWLLLMALPTYLAISDLGFTTSAKTDMAARSVRGDIRGARVTASSVAALLGVALTAIGCFYVAGVFAVDWTRWLNLAAVPLADARLVLVLGLVQIIGYQGFLLAAAVVRAAGRPATEVLLNAAFRLLETLALILAVASGGGVVAAAAAWALARLATTIALWVVLQVTAPALMPRVSAVQWPRVRDLLRPSLGYMLLPLASAIIIQGTVLVLGVVASPAAVAAYSTARIVTRLGVSAGNTLSYSFTPQYTYAAGTGDPRRFRSLQRAHAALLLGGTALYLVVMVGLGGFFVQLLSRGSVAPDVDILWLLAAAAAFEMLWSLPLAVGSASNRVVALSMTYLGLAVLCLALTVALSPSLGPIGAAAALAGTQAGMAVLSLFWMKQTGARAPSSLA